MRFNLIPDIQDLGNYLEQHYKGTNPQRLSFIAYLKTLKDPELILGAAVFELESIREEYHYLSPKRSDMYKLLHEKLKINKDNPLQDDERLIYIYKFYDYSCNQLPEETVEQIKKDESLRRKNCKSIWNKKKDLIAHVEYTLKCFRKHNAGRINFLVHATPELVALQKNTEKLIELYREEIKHRFFKNPKRAAMLDFIILMHKSCKESYLINLSPQSFAKEEDYLRYVERMQKMEQHIRLGLFVYVAMNIDKEYPWLNSKGGWLYSGSSMLKLCLKLLLNAENLNDLGYKRKIDWLKAVATHLEEMKDDIRNEKNHDLIKELIARQAEINIYKRQQEDERNQKTPANAAVSITTNVALYTGINYLIAAYGGQILDKVMSSAAAMMGPVGTAIYFSGKLIVSGLGDYVNTGAMSVTQALLFKTVLERLKIGEHTANLVTYKFAANKEGFENARRELCHADDVIFCDWVNTLLKMPDKFVTVAEKNQIRLVLGLDANAELKPLPLEYAKVSIFTENKKLDFAAPNVSATQQFMLSKYAN